MTPAGHEEPDEPDELDYLLTEVNRLRVQVDTLRSVLVMNTNVTADLMVLIGDPDAERRSQALLRVGDATNEINRLLSGQAFDELHPVKGEGG